MSRLIVKNLPAYLDEARLKTHFGARCSEPITDVKIVRRPDGTSRRFGFIGFKDEAEARDAQQYFNRTFIDTARIDVDVAKAIDDDGLRRERANRKVGREPKSVHTASDQTSAKARSTSSAIEKEEEGRPKAQSKRSVTFEEFMEVMRPLSKRKARDNGPDGDADARLAPGTFVEVLAKEPKRQKVIDQSVKGGKQIAEDEQYEPAAPDPVVNDEGVTDLEYMYKRMKRNVGVEPDRQEGVQFEQSDDDDNSKDNIVDESQQEGEARASIQSKAEEVDAKETRRQERHKKVLEAKARKEQGDADAIMRSGRLFVRNLPFEASEVDLEAYFSRYGEVTQAHLSLDRTTKMSKGIAFVTFQKPSHALAAFHAADGHTFQGRLLHILPAVEKGTTADAPKSLRDQKRQDLKAKSFKEFNWSTLYMNPDAVASSVAARLGIDKADILTPHEDEDMSSSKVSPAVRLAMAETSVINETRAFFEAEGVNVQLFEAAGSAASLRSDTVVLVKNMPYGTEAMTLQAMFEKHGTVVRTVMPPSGTIAIVEMQIAGEAKAAFRSLAYKRLGNSVLYLERAPMGVMSSRPVMSKDRAEASAPQPAAKANTGAASTSAEFAIEAATLYVKNLSFSTTEERLKIALRNVPGVTFVRIQKRTANKRDRNGVVMLSMGYGFVGFHTIQAARAAQKTMDKIVLDGHVLSVTLARRGHDVEDGASAQFNADDVGPNMAPSAKLIVKNLAFQATKKEVRALFAAHGKLKSVRVPRRGLANGGGTATGVLGFGFVEFVNRNEALHAYRALRHSHLLGRHMVLEWDTEGAPTAAGNADSAAASDERDAAIERLRLKTARSATASAAAAAGIGAHRRDKLRLGEEDIRQAVRDEQRRKAEGGDGDDDDDDDEGEAA